MVQHKSPIVDGYGSTYYEYTQLIRINFPFVELNYYWFKHILQIPMDSYTLYVLYIHQIIILLPLYNSDLEDSIECFLLWSIIQKLTRISYKYLHVIAQVLYYPFLIS